MPRHEISRSTSFIVEDESWLLVEYDHTSVPGVVYLSLTESKINKIYDDTENNIADLDRRAKYQVITPPTMQHFKVGDEIKDLTYTITKNGIPFFPKKVEYISSDKRIAHIENGKLIASNEGEVDIVINVPEYDDILPDTLSLKIIVDNENTVISYYIEGPSMIRLGNKAKYIIRAIDGSKIIANEYSINDIKYATINYSEEDQIYTIKANEKSLLGDFMFIAKINDIEISKKISVIPLW